MASEQYRIPWAPLDISRGVADLMGGIQQRRENERADEYMRLAAEDRANTERRISAEEKRREADDARKRAIETFTARPGLERMARHSVPGANENPYGIKFEEGYDLPSNVEGPEMSPAAEAARFALGQPKAGAPPAPVAAPAPQLPDAPDSAFFSDGGGPAAPAASPSQLQPNGYQGGGIDALSDNSRQITAENIANVGQGIGRPHGDLMPETPELPPSALAAASALGQPGPQGKHRIYEVGSHGDRFEIPEQSDKTPFGPEYDSIYQGLLEADPTMHPKDAMKVVAAQYKADQTQEHIATRTAENTAALIGGRDKNREDQQAFAQGENSKYKLTFEQRKELTNIMARAKVAAAGAGPVHPGLAVLVGMKEDGASDEEIYAAASKMKGLSQKEVVTPVQNVVKNAAAGERAGKAREALVATDTHGKQIGVWKSPVDAREGQAQNEAFQQVELRMRELIDHVKQYGSRIDPDTQQYQDRLSLGSAVNAALRPYNKLGGTDASQRLEADITGALGAPGHGWLLGANLEGLNRIMAGAVSRHETMLSQRLRPGGGSQLAPALGGPKHGQQGEAHPAQAPVGETRQGPDGRTYRKVGPNNWQPVSQ